MRFLKPRRATTLFICLVATYVFGAVGLKAQQTTRISGKISAAFTQQDSIIVNAAIGHVMSLTESEGKNVNTGDYLFMEDAQVVNMAFSDLVQGIGTHSGYIRFAQNGNATFAKWEGKLTTTLTSDGTPVTSFEGFFSYVRGTGQFENIKGGGTYRGKFTSKTEYYVEWQGDYFIEK